MQEINPNENDQKVNMMLSNGCSQAEIEIVEEARDFASSRVAPDIERFEMDRAMPVDLLREGIALFGGLLVPRELGGQEARVRLAASVLSEVARADLGFAFSLVCHLNLTGAIARNGTTVQKDRYLPEMMAGNKIGAFCLTEPDAGTDPAALTTQARSQQSGDWQITGEKAWITNAAAADVFCVYARIGDTPGSRAIGSFLIESNELGATVTQPYSLMGGNVMGTGGLVLDDCSVDADRAFAPEGEGFKAAMQGIDLARVVLSAMCCAILEDSLAIATGYAADRRTFGQSTLEFQGIQFPLADVATQLRAAQLLTSAAVEQLDSGMDARVEAAHAKKASSRAAFGGIATAMQAMGARGFHRDYPLARHLACAKMAEYLDGTSEVQNIVIGRSLGR